MPNPKKFSNAKLISSSLHYTGYSIVFLFIGYFVLFFVLCFIVLFIRLISNIPLFRLDLLKYVLPVVSIFVLKKLFIRYLSRYYLINKTGHNLRLKHQKIYQILNHFNFFFDCFLLTFLSSFRMIFSILLALFYMPRLDYTTFSMGHRRFDSGFMSYVGAIHMEGFV